MESGQLKDSLNFLHVGELRDLCAQLGVPDQGKKTTLIARVLYFLNTKEVLKEPKIPEASRAKCGQSGTLTSNALILKGVYKNNLKTRLFFKELIGEHFHFTAFGIDWINDRWMQGAPPTYLEFAQMWQSEYDLRKKTGSAAKQEWAYINFTQQFIRDNPNASRKSINDAWETERQKHKRFVLDQTLSEK